MSLKHPRPHTLPSKVISTHGPVAVIPGLLLTLDATYGLAQVRQTVPERYTRHRLAQTHVFLACFPRTRYLRCCESTHCSPLGTNGVTPSVQDSRRRSSAAAAASPAIPSMVRAVSQPSPISDKIVTTGIVTAGKKRFDHYNQNCGSSQANQNTWLTCVNPFRQLI